MRAALPRPPRGYSGRDAGPPDRELFGSNYKSYRGLPPHLANNASFSSANFAGGTPQHGGPTAESSQLPFMNDLDFQGRYKDKLLQQLNKSSMPHVKRMINNQVFLEETEPMIGVDEDAMRRNQHAIDAAQAILGHGHH